MGQAGDNRDPLGRVRKYQINLVNLRNMGNTHKKEGSVEWWRDKAEERLNNQQCVFLRNQEITANYARAYLKHPNLFKWAGMAAFASHHMRLALKPFALGSGTSGSIEPNELHGPKYRRLQNVSLFKEINDAIYNDIYWAHLAYDGSETGMERIRSAMKEKASYASLLGAFEKLDAARNLFEVNSGISKKADALAWEANIEILRHEQMSMVQPRFAKLASSFSRGISLFSTMHYQHGGRCKKMLLPGAFVAFRVARHPRQTFRKGISIVDFEQRWEWIRDGILPGFKCYESHRRKIERDLRKLPKVIE